jgi:HD superfamily phosphohydrolase
MAIAFDPLYGPINFAGREAKLIDDLLNTPEVIRLRRMRLLNFDSIVFQDLATTNRLAHSIGVSFLASQIGRFASSETERLEWVAAALIHDVGILPFGHLLEQSLTSVAPQFSHEALVQNIIRGTYHPTNVYHQILPGRSLGLSSVLKRHGLDSDRIIQLIQPSKGEHSILNGPLDIDNIDNIHRMVHLVGMEGARQNLAELQKSVAVRNGALVFEKSSDEFISRMVEYRRKMYATMIAHPATVPYNSLLLDVAESAISTKLLHEANWYLNDGDFTQAIKGIVGESRAAQAYISEHRYQLVDYIWIHFASSKASLIEEVVTKARSTPITGKAELFVWSENRKIQRSVNIRRPDGTEWKCGNDSASVLLALIDKSPSRMSTTRSEPIGSKGAWRLQVSRHIDEVLPREHLRVLFPEEFDSSEFSLNNQQSNSNQDSRQMRLFDA